MTREEITEDCLKAIDSSKCLLTLLSTGVGKTKITIDCINKICDRVLKEGKSNPSLLIVIYREVHIDTWKKEFIKWGGIHTDNVKFCCYASLHKHAGEKWDIVVLDECHHVGSDLKRDALKTMQITYNLIGLSATVSRDLRQWFRRHYDTAIVNCSTQDAIESNILPDPEIYLMPLTLNSTTVSELFEINKKDKSNPIVADYKDIWSLRRSRKHALIRCTKKQYLNELDSIIDFYKKKSMGGNSTMRNLWMRACNDRLIFLANAKNNIVKEILEKLRNFRTITFCCSIEQTEVLGKNCIHSKNKDRQQALDKFNNKKIKHITACHMLNEGVNLTDCRYGIFANINSSETIQIQRVGRALRHKEPILIIPFFRDTREEEIVRKWMENYNRELITIMTINELLHR